MTVGRFLAGIGALIWDDATDKYFLVRRVDDRDFQAGAWECITGRVDQGESFEEALHREVYEEIGGRVQIEFIVATTHFYRGQPSPENELLGLVYGCTALNQDEMAVGSEHSEGHWVSVDEAFKLLPDRHWLRQVITRAEIQKANLTPLLRDTFRNEGFDIG
jgi:8-oxo-dGTP diphosphatase